MKWGALTFLLAGSLIFALESGAAIGIKSRPGQAGAKAGEKAAEKEEGPFKPWKKVTQDAERMPGFFTVWKKPDQLYFEVQPDQLDQEFLGVFTFARGIGGGSLLGGLPLNDRVLAFHREGNALHLLERNVRFIAPAGTAFERAKELSYGHSVLASLKIESEHDSSKALLVDMTSVLVSDIGDIAERASQGTGAKSMRFDEKRSALTHVQGFPRNVEVEALLTFTPGDRKGLDLFTVPDDRYLPITVHYSFVALPEEPMKPRLADDRVGYFLAVLKDFSRDQEEHFFLRYLKRWRLEKRDPAAAVSEPVQPIVFWIDRTVPEQYRGWVKQGVENWQKAFEAAGFRNAIVAREAPSESEDPDWDAADVRYSTIRWIASGGGSFNAVGPSRMDPRTGEILDADILVEAQAMQSYRTSWRRYAGPTDLAEAVVGTVLPPGLPLELVCEEADMATDHGALMRATLAMDGSLPPGSPVPDEYLEPFVVRLVMHEVGHTLGLRHNFRSSIATPFAKLHDAAWTREHGLMGSVMDYVTPNISPDRSRQGEYFISSVGPYDVWAIRYGYAPSRSDDLDEDYRFAEKIAVESTRPGHEYGTDEDAVPDAALDPRTHRWDLSDDPLTWAEERAGYIAGLWRSGRFEQRILGNEGEYPALRRAMDTLLGQYGRTLGYAIRYIGGQYHVRDHRGQAGAEEPLQPVEAPKQRQALAFIGQRGFAPAAFKVAPELLNRLAPDRWRHWGQPDFYSPDYRLDYDLHNKALAIQSVLLRELLDPSLLQRVREAEDRSQDPFTLAEYMDRLTRTLWGEVDGAIGPGMRELEGPNTRRELQRAYVDRLADMVVKPPPALPDDARALARLQLVRVHGRAMRALAAQGLGDYTRAHLLETRARIERALAAGRETSG